MKVIKTMISLTLISLSMAACTKGCQKKEPIPKSLERQMPSTKKAQSTNSQKDVDVKEKQDMMNELNLTAGDNLFAELETSLGKIKVKLFWERAPKTVWNFVGLALGKKEWHDPKTGEKSTKPLYNDTIFHRVIKGFMIQGGDPMGTGMGGPGYRFKDEFHPDLRHDKKGVLSMANAGPNTNGSQFFITERPTPHLDNRHSVFGQVVDNNSLDLISKIAGVETSQADRPKKDVVLKAIRIFKG